MKYLFATVFAGVMCTVAPSFAAAVFETQNTATDEAKVFTFGSPVEADEIQTNNIGSASSCADGRFAFRAGTVNVREGGYVRANGNGTASSDKYLGNWLGANAGIATLNIEGGTFWMDVSGASNDGAGVLRVPVNGGANDAVLNLSSGVLKVDKFLHNGVGTMVVTNGGSYVTKGGLLFGNGAGAHGTLTITDGGTVEVSGNICFCYKANSDATLNLKRGGVLSAQRLYRRATGTATLNFDGGTLKAVADDKNLIDSNIAVVLNANSAIDNDGKNVTIVPTISGTAGLTLVGSGTTTISSDQEYLGATTVSSGTTLSANGCIFAGAMVFEAGAAVEVPSIPEGERKVAVLTHPIRAWNRFRAERMAIASLFKTGS